jgi:hypothetical protein
MNLFKVETIQLRDLGRGLFQNIALGITIDTGTWVISDGVSIRFKHEPIRMSEDYFNPRFAGKTMDEIWNEIERAKRKRLAEPDPTIRFSSIPDSHEDWKAIYAILKSAITGAPLMDSDVKNLDTCIGIDLPSYTIQTAPAIKVEIEYTFEKFVAEQLLAYLGRLGSNSKLLKFNPIGICGICEGLYLKKKLSQKYCTGECKQKGWYRDTLRDDPGYFARHAAKSREVKAKQKTARADSRARIKKTKRSSKKRK